VIAVAMVVIAAKTDYRNRKKADILFAFFISIYQLDKL